MDEGGQQFVTNLFKIFRDLYGEEGQKSGNIAYR
jgi:hypothetical protein